jgi:hypothetical protein
MSTSSNFTAEAGQSVLLHDGKFIVSLKTMSEKTVFITRLNWFVGTAAQADAKILELKLKVKPAAQ